MSGTPLSGALRFRRRRAVRTGGAAGGRIWFAQMLRGLAVITVLIEHMLIAFWINNPGSAAVGFTDPVGWEVVLLPHVNPSIWLVQQGIVVGEIGVALFFLISGFVIPMSLERYRPGRFLVGRVFRLYPVWIACLILTAVAFFLYAQAHDRPFPYDWTTWWQNATMFQDWTQTQLAQPGRVDPPGGGEVLPPDRGPGLAVRAPPGGAAGGPGDPGRRHLDRRPGAVPAPRDRRALALHGAEHPGVHRAVPARDVHGDVLLQPLPRRLGHPSLPRDDVPAHGPVLVGHGRGAGGQPLPRHLRAQLLHRPVDLVRLLLARAADPLQPHDELPGRRELPAVRAPLHRRDHPAHGLLRPAPEPVPEHPRGARRAARARLAGPQVRRGPGEPVRQAHPPAGVGQARPAETACSRRRRRPRPTPPRAPAGSRRCRSAGRCRRRRGRPSRSGPGGPTRGGPAPAAARRAG